MLKYLVQPILYHLSNLKNDICVFSFHSISIVCSLIHLLQLRTHKPDKPVLFLNLSTLASHCRKPPTQPNPLAPALHNSSQHPQQLSLR